MKKQMKFITLLVLAVMLAVVLCACGFEEQSVTERTQVIVDAYQDGDMETLMKKMDDRDNRMKYFMDALDDENPEGIAEIYQQVWNMTKDAEVHVEQEDSDTAVVTVKTVDIKDAMVKAMDAAAMESKESYADVMGWMSAALDSCEKTTEIEVKVRTHSSGRLIDGQADDLFMALTGNFYYFITTTMTTCEAIDGTSTYMLGVYDNVYTSLDEYVISDEGIPYTDEEVEYLVDEYINSYGAFHDAEGTVIGGTRVEGGIRLYVYVNYEIADTYALYNMGLITTSADTSISVKLSIDGLKEQGYSCKRTDFGSGYLDNVQ